MKNTKRLTSDVREFFPYIIVMENSELAGITQEDID